MFYSHELLHFRNGKLGIVWLAATKSKISRKKVLQVNIKKACQDILALLIRRNSQHGLSLYLAAQLMYGAGVIYERQLTIIIEDLKSFQGRSRVVILPMPVADMPSQLAIKKTRKHVENEIDLRDPTLEMCLRDSQTDMGALTKDIILDEAIIAEIERACVARYEDITLMDEELNLTDRLEKSVQRVTDDFGDSLLFSMGDITRPMPQEEFALELFETRAETDRERREEETGLEATVVQQPESKRRRLMPETRAPLDESIEQLVASMVNERMSTVACSTALADVRYAEMRRQVMAELGLPADADVTDFGAPGIVDLTDIQALDSLLQPPPITESRGTGGEAAVLTPGDLGTISQVARKKRSSEEDLEGPPAKHPALGVAARLTFDADHTALEKQLLTTVEQVPTAPPQEEVLPPEVAEAMEIGQPIQLEYNAPEAPHPTAAPEADFVVPLAPPPLATGRIRRGAQRLLLDRETEYPMKYMIDNMNNSDVSVARKKSYLVKSAATELGWIPRPGPWVGQWLVMEPDAESLLSHPTRLTIWNNGELRERWQIARNYCLHTDYAEEMAEDLGQRRVTSTPVAEILSSQVETPALSVERERATLSAQESRRLTQTGGQTSRSVLKPVGSILELEEREEMLTMPPPVPMEEDFLLPVTEIIEREQEVVPMPLPEAVPPPMEEVSLQPILVEPPMDITQPSFHDKEPEQQEDLMLKLHSLIEEFGSMECKFTDIVPSSSSKRLAATMFRSLLGLLKNKQVKATQDEPYGDIFISKPG